MTGLLNNNFTGKSIVSLTQFTDSDMEMVFSTAQKLMDAHAQRRLPKLLDGKIATLLFFEPSSRTFSSFTAAVKRLGGDTISYQNPTVTSSYQKGETLEDSARVFSHYSDVIIVRHPEAGAPHRVAEAASVPVINAGDGPGEHPTQALFDLFTIKKKHGRLDHLQGIIAGDLLYGRTVHSLLQGFAMFPGNSLSLLSPKRLALPDEMIREYEKRGLKLNILKNEKEMPTDAHFWYWTRVQKERFDDLNEYERLKTSFVITPELLEAKGNDKMIILHPLPRVGEIDPRIDHDPRALYLTDEIKNGLFVRMALVALVNGATLQS